MHISVKFNHNSLSPPSRGAWIEIFRRWMARNSSASPPSRGAWIEIMRLQENPIFACRVAPLAGGVD